MGNYRIKHRTEVKQINVSENGFFITLSPSPFPQSLQIWSIWVPLWDGGEIQYLRPAFSNMFWVPFACWFMCDQYVQKHVSNHKYKEQKFSEQKFLLLVFKHSILHVKLLHFIWWGFFHCLKLYVYMISQSWFALLMLPKYVTSTHFMLLVSWPLKKNNN